MPRKFSDAFIEQQIARIDAMHQRIQDDTIVYPSCLMPSNEYGRGMSEYDRAAIKKYFKQLRDMAYIQGFWMGWVTKEGVQ